VIEQPPAGKAALRGHALYEGETLERRLTRAPVGLAEGVAIAGKIARRSMRCIVLG